VQANLHLRNLAGIADQWRLTGEYGHRSSFDFAAMFRLPRARGGPWTVCGRRAGRGAWHPKGLRAHPLARPVAWSRMQAPPLFSCLSLCWPSCCAAAVSSTPRSFPRRPELHGRPPQHETEFPPVATLLTARFSRPSSRPLQPDFTVFRRSTNLEYYSSFADTMRGLELGVSRWAGKE
jgi:hypothetical protein